MEINMKKLIALVTALVLVFSLVGCGAAQVGTSAVWYTDKEKNTDGIEEKASKEMNNLVDGMMDEGFLKKTATVTVMDPVKQEVVNGKDKGKTKSYGGYKLVGADEGYRFTVNYNESNVNIELYYYEDYDETAEEIISEVKKDGEFTLLEEKEKIKAYISKDEKFLMIYQDSSNDKKNKKQEKEAVSYFTNYEIASDNKVAEETTADQTKENTTPTEETTKA